jgi:proteasome accessory factor A
MKDRVIGIENEFAFLTSDEHENFLNAAQQKEAHKYFTYTLGTHAPGKYGLYNGRLWLSNGGCLYGDMEKLEWASPECRRIRDVVSYNKAGERLATRVSGTYSHEDEIRHFYFFKTNVAPAHTDSDAVTAERVSFGCHENYMIHCSVAPNVNLGLYMPLVPFLVTRLVYGGAGWWPNGYTEGFSRSQRAHVINLLSNVTATASGGRSILNTRNESFIELPKGSIIPSTRFHLVLGDANMLEYALFLKVGATALVIALLEEGILPDWEVQPEKLYLQHSQKKSDPACIVMKRVAREPDLHRKILRVRERGTGRWEYMSPLELQTAYLEHAHRFCKRTSFCSEESESEAFKVCSMWDETLSALARNDKNFLFGRIDWYTKKHIAETEIAREMKQKKIIHPNAICEDIDVLYHEIARDSLYHQLLKEGVAVRMVSDEEITRATTLAPPPTAVRGTRATLRGAVVRAVLDSPRAADIQAYVHPGWSEVKYGNREHRTNYEPIDRFNLSDPLQYQSSDFDEFLERMLQEIY